MDHQKAKNERRTRRAFRVRSKIRGTAERPRLTIRRSLKHIYCQVIDDSQGKTIVSASTVEKEFGSKWGGNCTAAAEVGKTLADRIKAAGVGSLCVDRGSSGYQGRIAALTDALREAGINC